MDCVQRALMALSAMSVVTIVAMKWYPMQVCCRTCAVHHDPIVCCNAVDSNKKGITRGVISVQPHPLRPSGNAALIAVGTSAGSIAVLESLGRYNAA